MLDGLSFVPVLRNPQTRVRDHRIMLFRAKGRAGR